jgi:prolyl oligopeptidase
LPGSCPEVAHDELGHLMLMLQTFRAQGDALLVTYLRDVASVLQLRSLSTGVLLRELPMPGYGSVKEVCGRRSLSQMYYSFESMTDAGSTYK